ncbi:helix-turn-helix domain-containing protein [Tabrizicola piscis]|uniref:Helix-turn-helix domain-containing protein n=1 Tax=Tabrizicola piscis TaxID=2494374 RepID=A0A3S8UBD0_9RHOB|nr:helix-turn-helix domain-containing protein [Tabrizicola piscis]AZL60869.1 helix-turn-helix domain-containing protein [Tabrizicola piscis]
MIGWRSKPSTTEEDKPKGFDDFELRLGDLMRGERATLGKSLLDVQRELKIKATYIAAIENADLSAFETPGFVAGYVRSYARYLAMDPDWAFERFCAEAGYAVSHGLSAAAAPQQIIKARARSEFSDPLGNPNASFVPRGEAMFARVEPGAVGSIAVLIALIGAIGYGGWSVLQEVQRVQLAPVDEAPTVVAQIDPLANAGDAAPQLVTTRADTTSETTVDLAEADTTSGSDMMDRLYRPQALDVPVLTSRDGPIAAIDPRQTGVLADAGEAAAVDAAISEALGPDVQVVASAQQGVEVLAVRPAWVRVDAADGTVLFEKILDAGERYAVPALEEPPVFRTGNSGSVYFVVDGATLGPVAPGANVVRNIALSPEALTQTMAAADLTADEDLARFATADATGVAPAVEGATD